MSLCDVQTGVGPDVLILPDRPSVELPAVRGPATPRWRFVSLRQARSTVLQADEVPSEHSAAPHSGEFAGARSKRTGRGALDRTSV